MTPDMENIEFAQNNQDFADDILSDFPDQKNWVVTVRFYSFIHYVEEKLKIHDISSNTHQERKDNIRNCRGIDNRARNIYRMLEDLSRDARYECKKMDDNEVEKTEEKLEEGKNVLGFTGESSGSDTKYST